MEESGKKTAIKTLAATAALGAIANSWNPYASNKPAPKEKEFTEWDQKKIDKAEAKRERRRLRNIKNAAKQRGDESK